MKIWIAVFTSLLISAPAYAQFGGTIVSDPPTEANTAATVAALGTANATLAAIQTSVAAIVLSVTTPCDPGLYTGVSQYLDGLDGLLTGAGVSPSAMVTMFPGWLPLFPDAIPADATIATVGLSTYEAAVQVAQSQAADFDVENTYVAGIEAMNVGAIGLLCAQQIATEATLGLISQVMMLRQLVVASITVNAFDHGETLNERAQQQATDAQTFNFGVSPQ